MKNKKYSCYAAVFSSFSKSGDSRKQRILVIKNEKKQLFLNTENHIVKQLFFKMRQHYFGLLKFSAIYLHQNLKQIKRRKMQLIKTSYRQASVGNVPSLASGFVNYLGQFKQKKLTRYSKTRVEKLGFFYAKI